MKENNVLIIKLNVNEFKHIHLDFLWNKIYWLHSTIKKLELGNVCVLDTCKVLSSSLQELLGNIYNYYTKHTTLCVFI